MEDEKLKTAFEHLEVAKRHIERAEQECDEIGEKDIAQNFGYTTSKPQSNKWRSSSKANLVRWTSEQIEARSFDKALRKRLEAHGYTPEGTATRAS